MGEKRYYWLKLERGFYDRHDIKLLEADSPEYVVFHDKLMCESIDHEGELRFSETRPYTHADLAVVLKYPLDFVEAAMASLERHELVTKTNTGTIVVTLAVTRIGTESASAERMRRHRERNADISQDSRNNVTKSDGEVTQSKSKSKSKREESAQRDETRRANLIAQYGQAKYDDYEQRVRDYMASKDKRYKSIPATVANWLKRDGEEPLPGWGVKRAKSAPTECECGGTVKSTHNEALCMECGAGWKLTDGEWVGA